MFGPQGGPPPIHSNAEGPKMPKGFKNKVSFIGKSADNFNDTIENRKKIEKKITQQKNSKSEIKIRIKNDKKN